MRTNVRGRTTSRPRTTSSRTTRFPGGTTHTGWGTTRPTSKTSRTAKQNRTNVPVAYRNWNYNFQNKINSFRTLYNQTWGPAKCARPTVATLNTFTNWINKGAIVQVVTPTQVAKWAKYTKKTFNVRTATPTTCKNVLLTKFGKNTIKAVARTKSGSFMVATAPTWKGKPFWFPK